MTENPMTCRKIAKKNPTYLKIFTFFETELKQTFLKNEIHIFLKASISQFFLNGELYDKRKLNARIRHLNTIEFGVSEIKIFDLLFIFKKKKKSKQALVTGFFNKAKS